MAKKTKGLAMKLKEKINHLLTVALEAIDESLTNASLLVSVTDYEGIVLAPDSFLEDENEQVREVARLILLREVTCLWGYTASNEPELCVEGAIDGNCEYVRIYRSLAEQFLPSLLVDEICVDGSVEQAYYFIKATQSNELCDIALAFTELVQVVREDLGFELIELQGRGRALSPNKLKPSLCYYSRALIDALTSEIDLSNVRKIIREMHSVLNFSTQFLGGLGSDVLTPELVSEGFFAEGGEHGRA